jgi:DNA-binding winged helix-turn-helix (wHTH) protein/Tol biopolymer transport system component
MDQLSRPVYEFAGFRLDVAAQTLIGPDARAITLSSRAFDTLRHLVERAGELVEKAELMKAVWPKTVVEENNLSQCIVAIRKALREEAGERKFVLTVPGRGFKFVAQVRVISPAAAAARPSVAAPAAASVRAAAASLSGPAARSSRLAMLAAIGRRHRWLAGALLAMAVLFAAILVRRLPDATPAAAPAATSAAEYEALTDVPDSASQPALSRDGRLLAYVRGGAAFLSAGQIWLKTLPAGESLQLTHEHGLIFAPTFTPDGTHVAYSVVDRDRPGAPWDTRIVPITGGEAALLLPNASGLHFIGPHELMYSEFKAGVHLGIVTSLDDRSRHRDVYLPEHERGMAHFSFVSPDRRSVLVVEMGGDGHWQRCRLVPFDGATRGRPVGPDGACTSAAWSPDGRWMYFAAALAGHSHLWRQRFPDGAAEQITFGPTQESDVAVSPDGHALLSSVGQWQSTIWVHAGKRERPLATEGFAFAPWLSNDDRRVYYLAARSSEEGAELSRVNIASGQRESLLPELAVRGYDVSADERLAVFTIDTEGMPEIWVAPLDHSTPPVRLVRGGDQVAFDAARRIYYRSVGVRANYLHRMNADGSGDVALLGYPIADFQSVAPDGSWVAVGLPLMRDIGGVFLAPVAGGRPQLLAEGWSPVRWSRDGKRLYTQIGSAEQPGQEGRTSVLRLRADGLPVEPLPLRSYRGPAIPHALRSLSIGADPAAYVYLKTENWQNIYRIPLH